VPVSSLVSIGPAVWPAIRNKQTDRQTDRQTDTHIRFYYIDEHCLHLRISRQHIQASITVTLSLRGSTTFDRRHLPAGHLAAGHLTVRHLTPSRFYRGQLTAKACKRILLYQLDIRNHQQLNVISNKTDLINIKIIKKSQCIKTIKSNVTAYVHEFISMS